MVRLDGAMAATRGSSILLMAALALAGCETQLGEGRRDATAGDAGPWVDGGPAGDLDARIPSRDFGPDPTDGGSPPPPDLGGGTALTPGTRTVEVSAGGMTRQVLLHVPAGWSSGDATLVALHGNGDSAGAFLGWTGLQSLADAEGFAIASPEALSGHFMGVDWDAYTQPASANIDLQVTFAARDLLLAGGGAPSRIYLLGHSQGGFLAFHAAMVASTTFAAVHVASAAKPLSGLEAGATRKIPVDLLIGSNDGLVAVARETRDELQAAGFEVRFTEVPGTGHCCPLMGRAGDVWAWLSARSL